ncbi:RPA-related protein RADX [Alosa sapidissima]|uniref:RPA-related protein RADX n=1 Tax=Alosa sapidissima TaxID=34773 RepID=UPI001C080A26|nr:RPA-related protein RADX [Alosa sapidissima]
MASSIPAQPPSCALQRTLRKLSITRVGTGQNRTCQEPLYVLSLDRYMKDANFAVFFQGSIHASDSLYDATLTDGDCKIRVSIEPRLNHLIVKKLFRCGSTLKNVEFLVEQNTDKGNTDILVTNLELDQQSEDAALLALSEVNVKSLPWWAGEEPSSLPLRARRSTYLPLWNDYDFSGEMWRDRPPDDMNERSTSSRAPVSLREVRQRFLSDGSRIRGDVRVRILQKSRLIHYGKAEQNCLCPYRAELQVADESASVSVVLWNTMCMEWYRRLHPGMVLRLSRFRVRESFSHRIGQNPEPDIEISLNSSHPSAIISIVSPVSPEWHLPDVPHDFCKGTDLQSRPHGSICDVVGLVIFTGRPECVKNKEGKMDHFRWIQLEDGSCDYPVMVKLYSTSQPDVHSTIQPMAVFVCTRLQLVSGSSQFYYLTNTQYTQVYCTGTGCPLTIPYKGIHPFRQFLQWLDQTDEGDVMKRSVVGGSFIYPPPPASLKTFMEERKAQPGLISGQELKGLCENLQYRESQRFCVQCTISAVEYHHQDDGQTSVLSSPHLTTPTSPGLPVEPQPVKRSPRGQKRPNPITAGTPRKRLILPSSDSEEISDSGLSLFDSAMEFLIGDEKNVDDAGNDDDDSNSFVTADTSPACSFSLSRAAMETIPRTFCYRRRHVQASATGLQPNSFQKLLPFAELESFSPAPFYKGHYTLQLRALSDGVVVNALFLPASLESNHWRPLPHRHANSWESILSHGGFSPHVPPPSPADLMAIKTQLVNQKLVCVLEACPLGRNRLELVLSRAFPLQS